MHEGSPRAAPWHVRAAAAASAPLRPLACAAVDGRRAAAPCPCLRLPACLLWAVGCLPPCRAPRARLCVRDRRTDWPGLALRLPTFLCYQRRARAAYILAAANPPDTSAQRVELVQPPRGGWNRILGSGGVLGWGRAGARGGDEARKNISGRFERRVPAVPWRQRGFGGRGPGLFGFGW